MRKIALAAVGTFLLAVAGCGGAEGVADGAAVTAYVSAPLCAGAKRELVRKSGRASDFRVRIVCLPSVYRGRQLDLATLGANARRATGDSTTVAYLEAPNPKAARFTRPILESAVIPWISQGSGKAAMARLLTLISAADSGSLRESLREALHQV